MEVEILAQQKSIRNSGRSFWLFNQVYLLVF